MKQYRVIIPNHYDEIKALGKEVLKTIEDRKSPKPEDISKVLGEDAVMPYYFMHALLRNLEHGRARSVLDYKRRNGIAIQTHSFDAAFKPYYRLGHKYLPSNYVLTPREITGDIVHDLGEEFGQDLLGAIVVNDVIRYVLGDEAGKDADVLTNKNALLLDSLEDRIKKDEPERIHKIIKKSKSLINVRDGEIEYHHRRVLNAVKQFRNYVQTEADYLEEPQKNYLLGIIDDIVERALTRVSQKSLRADEVNGIILQQYENVMGIMEKGEYLSADKKLLLPGDPKFLWSLKKTLYRDFIGSIAEKVKEELVLASVNDRSKDDRYLGAFIEKLSESIDTVANMEPNPLRHAISIFRKARISIPTGIDLVDYLGQESADYARLQMAVDCLYRNLEDSVNQWAEVTPKSSKRDSKWETYAEKFAIMKSKTEELGEKVREMNGPNWLRKRIRGVGKLLGVEKIGLGSMRFAL